MQNKKVENLDGLIVSATTLANILNITDRRVRQLVDEGILTKVKNGSYELMPNLKRYLSYIKAKTDNNVDNSPSKSDYLEEKTMNERAKRKIRELQLAHIEGKMHKSEDITRVITNMFVAFKSKIFYIPSKISPEIANTDEISTIHDIIKRELCQVLTELSEYDSKMFKSEDYPKEFEEE